MRTDAELRSQISRLQRQMAYFAARCQQFTSSLIRARHDLQVLTDVNKEKRADAINRITLALEPAPALAQFDPRNAREPGKPCIECSKGAPCPTCYEQWYIRIDGERVDHEKALEAAIAADAEVAKEAERLAAADAAASTDVPPSA